MPMPQIRQARATAVGPPGRATNGAEPQGGADATVRRRQRSAAVVVPMAAARGRAAGHGASGSLWPASAKPRRLDRPSMAARGDRVGHGHVRDVGWPRGDHAHDANYPEAVSCTNFKAPIKTKRLLLDLNHLHHAQDGI